MEGGGETKIISNYIYFYLIVLSHFDKLYFNFKIFFSFISFTVSLNAVLAALPCFDSFYLETFIFSSALLYNFHCLFSKSPDLYTVSPLQYVMMFNTVSQGVGYGDL